MDRYGISLGKTPPPPPPKPRERKPKEPKEKHLSDSERESIISTLLSNANGRMRLAASMINPLRQRLDTDSVARRLFQVESLPSGAIPLYDIAQESYMMSGDRRQIIHNNRRRVSVPLFEIASNPQISLDAVRERRFELIDQAQQMAIQDIRAIEGASAFSILESASSYSIVNGEASRAELAQLFDSVERQDLRVSNLIMGPREFSELRAQTRDLFDPVTRGDILRTGVMGALWGAQVIVSREAPAGRIYATSDPQFFGVIPVQTELTVLNADNPPNIEFSIFEQIGMVCTNPRAVSRLNLDGPVPSASTEMPIEPKIMVPRLDRYALLRALEKAA